MGQLGRRLATVRVPATLALQAAPVLVVSSLPQEDGSRRVTRRLPRFPESGRTSASADIAPFISIRATFRRFWPYTRGLRRLFAVGVVAAMVGTACEVAAIALFGRITDEVLSSGDLSAFWSPAAAWLGLTALAGGAAFASAYTAALGGERFLLRVRDGVFEHLQTLTPDYFENRRLGDLMARLTDDIEAIEELVVSGLIKLITALISVVFFATAAVFIRWDLALVTFALIPAFVLVSKGFAGRFRQAAARERLSNGAMNSAIEEALSNQALVQAYNRQETEAARLHTAGRGWLRANLAQARLSALYGPAVQVIETGCLLTIIGVGAWEIASGRLTLGGLLAFAAYLAYLYPQVRGLGETALTVSEAAAGSDRILEVLDARPTVVDRPITSTEAGTTTATTASGTVGTAADRQGTAATVAGGALQPSVHQTGGRIEFAGVHFTYPNRTRPTLAGLSFTARPGDLIVCTGPSGAGKSTIAKLLLRFYDPSGGRILLDGVDIRDLPHRTLRERVTLLTQENMLFSGTVRDNIAYGRSGADPAEIVRAAVTAGAHDFIRRLPEGYDTPVGQKGRLLSGGQRQRIAIARAVLRDAPVLILDEPMTGLDEATAARIMEPLGRLMSGRTTILITHDLRLMPDAAEKVVLGPAPATGRGRSVRLTRRRLGTPMRVS
ncbi:ABC transporter ATP-binding protein [Planotetraspora phitsanulokensis]|uniref:ABC transporter ATP-binding protein n=1 Tax=Planotetraspora phitsanulokensis TaxID=575192 RepID=A0A8J3TXZ7_9ACTN|nr:ABC transporter ATP-binding protein [Planotetraspora phitsanulokensis]GII35138.1 ABC transporter ATP-binding protein [Planotetraspora phitsanulokensis]